MTKSKNDNDRDQDNDNHEYEHDKASAVVPTPAGSALTSLSALDAMLANVDTASIVGRSGLPLLLFKREGSGTWMYGQRRTVPEDRSRWAINPTTFRRGYVCFNNANKRIGEHLVGVSQPMPDPTALPDKGSAWVEQWAVNLKCMSGADAGVEVTFKTTTVGGVQAIAGLIDIVRDQLNGSQHDNKVAPIVLLERDSYGHTEHGRVWTPVLTVVDWMPLSGPAPAPQPASPPPPANTNTAAPAQPRRRRVG